MKICQLCSAHDINDSRVFQRTCLTLEEAGYEVHLFAKAKGDSPFQLKNVNIHPVPQAATRVDRIRNRYQIARCAAELEPDIYHVHEPELLGPTLKHAGSKPVIWDVHEAYLEVILDREWIPKYLRKIVRLAWDAQERKLLPRCAGIISATDEVGRRYHQLHRNCVTVRNFPKLSSLNVVPFHLRQTDLCVFTGTIKENRGISETIKAFHLLALKGNHTKFIMAGACEKKYFKKIQAMIREYGLENSVKIFGKMTYEESIALASTSTIGLIPHLPYGNNLAAWPIKMMEYMGLGLPLIYSDLPSHHEIAGPNEIGIAIDARSPGCIADAIEQLAGNTNFLERAGANARQRALEALDWQIEKLKLLNFYEQIACRSLKT
jgi:glycosyltransferase involved in cell wall biosynthesis